MSTRSDAQPSWQECAHHLAASTNIALLANTYNGIYEELRLEEKVQEARITPKEKKFQNLPAGRQVAGEAVKL